MLLERLRNEETFSCELDYAVLAFDLDCDVELIRSVINDFGLFEIFDEGRRFHSVELTAQMAQMMESKKKRSEAAKNAADCRWGKNTQNNTERAERIMENVQDEKDFSGGETLLRNNYDVLDQEIQEMSEDAEWLDSVREEFSLKETEMTGKLSDFRDNCIRNGQKNGHKDMIDAKSHFRSYLRKMQSINSGNRRSRGTNLSERLRVSDREQLERQKEYNKTTSKAQSADNYLRNQGYDPTECTFRQIGDPEWIKDNPPSHPEWIGRFPGKQTVEEVEKILEMESTL